MLPRVFGWQDFFNSEFEEFPKFSKWFKNLRQDPVFESARQDIYEYWEEMDRAGQFAPIRSELESKPHYKWNYTNLNNLKNSHLSDLKQGPTSDKKKCF